MDAADSLELWRRIVSKVRAFFRVVLSLMPQPLLIYLAFAVPGFVFSAITGVVELRFSVGNLILYWFA